MVFESLKTVRRDCEEGYFNYRVEEVILLKEKMSPIG